MTSKYNVQDIINRHDKYDAEHELGRQKAMDEVWNRILTSASMNICKATYSIGTYYDGQLSNDNTTKLFNYLRDELNKICKICKFKIERSIGHHSQCDCEQKQGCREFIEVTWDRDNIKL